MTSSLLVTYVTPGPVTTSVHEKIVQHMTEALGSGFAPVESLWGLL